MRRRLLQHIDQMTAGCRNVGAIAGHDLSRRHAASVDFLARVVVGTQRRPFERHPRDLQHAQFEWGFQRQLYDCLHDYMVEMFIRTPQDRADRQRKGL